MAVSKSKTGRTKRAGATAKAVPQLPAKAEQPSSERSERAAKAVPVQPAPVETVDVPEVEAVAETPVANTPAPVEPVAAAQDEIETRIETSEIVEGIIKMTTKTEAVTDRVQAILGEVNERARTALETNARLVEELTEISRGNVEALVTSSKAAARGVEALGQEAAEYGRKSFEEVSSAFRGFSAIKSPADLFRLQSELAKSQFDSIVTESSRVSEAVIKLAGEVFEPLSTRYSVAAERVKNVVAA